jgi:protein gp37
MLHAEDHIFLLLTKRVARAKESLDAITYLDLVLPNVWLGVSVEDQATWDERVDILRQTPAAHRFVSYEPALGPLGDVDLTGIDWVVAGCESGPGRRPALHDWFRVLDSQCFDANVPLFLKQLSSNEDGTGKVVKMPELDGVRHEAVGWGSE